jgi:hypothetical protein
MANLYKKLAESAPAAGVLTDAYTVGGAVTGVIVSSIVVANRSVDETTFRISHAIGALPDADSQYIAYDVVVPGTTSYIFTIGATATADDVFRVLSDNGACSFAFYGQEVT